MPKISVIIPTYNGGKFIKKAIESVLDQTLDDFEIIVVDDGSTDNTPYILQEYIRTNNIVYISQKNVGVAVARNNGINMSKGTYIAFLDDDDFWIDKDKLKKQIEFLENHPDYVMVGTAGIVVDEKGKRVTDYKVPEGDHSIRDSILMRNPFIQSSIVAKKDILNQAGLYSVKDYVNAEDYNLWLRVGLLGKMENLKEPMTAYLTRNGNTSSNHKKEVLRSNILFIKEYKNKYPNYLKSFVFSYIKLIIYTVFYSIGSKKTRDMITAFMYKWYRKLFN